MKKLKRSLVVMLAMFMMVGTQSLTVFADEENVMEESGMSIENAKNVEKIESELASEGVATSENENVKTEDEENSDLANEGVEAYAESDGMGTYVEELPKSGTCGDNLTWTLSDDGTLTISGTGEMWDYGYGSSIVGAGTELEQEQVKKVVVEEGVTSIGEEAFSFCYGLTEVSLPVGLTSIGGWAFEDCKRLTKINLPEGLRAIGEGAFSECGSLVEIHLPESLTSIGGAAFQKCMSLTEIIIPIGVEKIEGSTFYYCSSLKEVMLPKSQTSIDALTFSHCSSLTEINLPEGVSSIGYEAFNACNSLKRIEFPKGLDSIDFNAFGACSALEEIYFWGDAPSMEDNKYDVFIGVTANVYYPENNLTWTEEERQKYADERYGVLTWIPWNPISRLQIIEAATDDVYVNASGSNVTIKCTGAFSDFVSVDMDGQFVDPSCYNVSEGSTVLIFLSSYLDTLSVGDHVVTLNYTYGSIDTTLTVLERKTNTTENSNGTNVIGSAGNMGNPSGTSNVTQNVSTQGGAPKTGDNTLMTSWLLVMMMAGGGCVLLAWTKKRKLSR